MHRPLFPANNILLGSWMEWNFQLSPNLGTAEFGVGKNLHGRFHPCSRWSRVFFSRLCFAAACHANAGSLLPHFLEVPSLFLASTLSRLQLAVCTC
jgi:hypothetical protein